MIKGDLMNMINDFYLGNLDLARLNYGVITLVPKVKETNNVKQYRSICLLNVSFKIFTKVLTNRLSTIAQKIIRPSQTAFIPGRHILEGVVILHETIHEMHKKKEKWGCFKT